MAAIRAVVHADGPSIGFAEADISTLSLRAVGAMAQVCRTLALNVRSYKYFINLRAKGG